MFDDSIHADVFARILPNEPNDHPTTLVTLAFQNVMQKIVKIYAFFYI